MLEDIEAEGDNLYSVTIMANEVARGPVELALGGIDFGAYKKNPVVLWIHDQVGHTEAGGLPIGMTRKLVETPSGEIRAWFEFLVGDPFVDRIKNAWDKGFLRAASVAWRALESEPTARGWRDTRSELLEWSLVPVPADPDAVRSLYSQVMRSLLGVDAVAEGEPLREPREKVIFDHTEAGSRDREGLGMARSASREPDMAGDLERLMAAATELENALRGPENRIRQD
jgi:hypothetical protein